MNRQIGLGLLGLGNVGSGLVKLVNDNGSLIESRSGLKLEIRHALVKNPKKKRNAGDISLTKNPADIFNDPDVDIVVELIGGLDPPFSLAMESLSRGKHLVTANKTLIAEHGNEIFSKAAVLKRRIGFEAAVCGGIPLIRALSSGLIANRIKSIYGILNGTTNYILSKMFEENLDYETALKQAQEKGFAEPVPTLDVNGKDAAQKIAILGQIAFNVQVDWNSIPCEGIESLESEDIHFARDAGYVIRLLAFGIRINSGFDFRVHPTLVPKRHPLANVRNEYNGVVLHGDATDDQLLYGKGAGKYPTASAVLSDILDIALYSAPVVQINNHHEKATFCPVPECYYIRVPIPDKPGAIGRITTCLGKHDLSISQALASLKPDKNESGNVRVLTHPAPSDKIQEAISEISRWPEAGKPVAIPILKNST